jgi:hypothetical protein
MIRDFTWERVLRWDQSQLEEVLSNTHLNPVPILSRCLAAVSTMTILGNSEIWSFAFSFCR